MAHLLAVNYIQNGFIAVHGKGFRAAVKIRKPSAGKRADTF